jgi:outer membrane receptor protein involved in Fe transport
LDFALADAIGLTAIPTYWDVQTKMVYDLSPRQKLTLNSLYGTDKIKFDSDKPDAFSRGSEAVDYRGDRTILGLRLRSLWANGFSDIVLSGVKATTDVLVEDANYDEENRLMKSPELHNFSHETVGQLSGQYNGEVRQHDTWAIGGAVKPVRMYHDIWFANDTTIFEDGFIHTGPDGNPDTLIQPEYTAYEKKISPKYNGFVQYTYRLRDNLSATGGLRYDGLQYSGKHTVGPRGALLWDMHPRWTASVAYGWYYQAQPFWYYTSDPNGGNKELPHTRAIQYIAGLKFRPRESSLLSLEGYYKEYDHVTVSEQDYVRESTGDYTFRSERLLSNRTKTAYGVELFAQQKLATNWYGTFSYSLGQSENHDEAFGDTPADYDFRHVVAVVAGYKTSLIKHEGYKNFTRKWYGSFLKILPINGDELQFSTRYRLMTGRPYDRRVWLEEGNNSFDPIYEAHWTEDGANNARYPSYERFDLRLDNKHYLGRTALIFFLEVQNAFDRGNVAEYIFADDGVRDTLYQFRFFFVGGVRVEL